MVSWQNCQYPQQWAEPQSLGYMKLTQLTPLYIVCVTKLTSLIYMYQPRALQPNDRPRISSQGLTLLYTGSL